MDIKKDFQFHFETGSQDFYMMEYLLPPIILFLGIILFYVFIKKRILRDEKEDLESLKLLQELLDAGTITGMNLKRKRTVLHQNGDERVSPSYLSLNDLHPIHNLQ